jgi:hypothetical protein
MGSSLYDFSGFIGSIIAGLLALVAGYMVYRGATRAAEHQVAAMNAQIEAVRQQNRYLRNENQRRLAQDGVVAVKLLRSILGLIREDVTKLSQLLDQPQYVGPNRLVPASYRQLIYKPALSLVWDDLGACGSQVISNYLILDAKLSAFMRIQVYTVDVIQNELQAIVNILDALDRELESDAARHNHVLSETSQQD